MCFDWIYCDSKNIEFSSVISESKDCDMNLLQHVLKMTQIVRLPVDAPRQR